MAKNKSNPRFWDFWLLRARYPASLKPERRQRFRIFNKIRCGNRLPFEIDLGSKCGFETGGPKQEKKCVTSRIPSLM